MNIFITGSTGFVGREICTTLLKKGHQIRVLIRSENNSFPEEIEKIQGDIMAPDSWRRALHGIDAVINLIGIIREFPGKSKSFRKSHVESTAVLVRESIEAEVPRFIQMSANGADLNLTQYQKTKLEAEAIVRSSGLNYTIFRPSLIYGPEDKFINMLNSKMKIAPFFPYFGKGDYRLQPVHVSEVAEIFSESIHSEAAFRETFSVCGKKVLSYRELLMLILKVCGRKRILFPLPELFIKAATTLLDRFSFFPITKDQFTMLKQGNTCSNNDIFRILNIKQKDIEEELNSYLK